MLDNSKNIVINGGSFTSSISPRVKGIDLLREHITPGAFHNSAERYDPPKCHPRTRLAVVESIMAWVEDIQRTSFILWLYGPAGAGKSAIAQTIADLCYDLNILVASFFWSRNAPGRNDEKWLITSLAYQLAIAIPEIRIHVEEALEKDHSLLDRSLQTQMESFIVKPLKAAFPPTAQSGPEDRKPRIVILDGLDECGNSNSQRYILNVISSSVQKFSIPIAFLIASRPEQEIRDAFGTQPLLTITRRLALDDTYRPDNDIRLFLVDSFEFLKQAHTLKSLLPRIWPSRQQIDTLVRKSSGQFIYPATVIKFVCSPRRRPDHQLDLIFGIADTATHTPFTEVDALYRHIFGQVEQQHLRRVLDILSCLFLLPYPNRIAPLCSKVLEDILSYQRGDVHLALSDLHSVLDVPDIVDTDRPLRVLHASLQDFFMDPLRSRSLYIDKARAHARLAQHLLQYIDTLSRSGNKLRKMDQFALNDRLVDQCLRSHPTKELLEAFFNFDLEPWVSSSLLSISPKPELVYRSLFQLSAWFKKQEASVRDYFGPDMNLYSHHSRSLDIIVTRLIQDNFSTSYGRNKIAAFLHPSFSQVKDFSEILEVLAFRLNLSIPWQRLEAECFRSQKSQVFERLGYGLHVEETYKDSRSSLPVYSVFCRNDQIPEDILELQQFLRDPKRAGKCFVDEDMYTALSLQIITYVFEKLRIVKDLNEDESSIKRRKNALTWAIESLPFYLSSSKYTSELADYLVHHEVVELTELPSYANVQPFRHSIKLYLSQCSQLEGGKHYPTITTAVEPRGRNWRLENCHSIVFGSGKFAQRIRLAGYFAPH
ncbi:hypothetical protein GALMADRAFT_155464 [Galerina marginata CBS 339.88]|uniref:Nephrocystin 3-like N-terminal domain-containing protein n=1 Tax=Galerina marginata (strain CBS 339.88) TaxID=685588 RepID=A0A067T5J5_GALM3|nr:hypothetical protein GALMADRAFT_155464 [Galerina marginata CBS 339.88]